MLLNSQIQNEIRKGKVIVAFDDDCRLCNNLIQLIARHDYSHKFRFTSLQSIPVQENSVVCFQRDIILTQSAAVIRILKEMGSFWKIIGIILQLIPRLIRDQLYQFVARNRKKWFGQSCNIQKRKEVIDRLI